MWTPEHRQAAARRGLRYPSDLTDAEWALIEMIPPARRGGRPRDVNVREVLNGIFYVLWTGCQWSALRTCRRSRGTSLLHAVGRHARAHPPRALCGGTRPGRARGEPIGGGSTARAPRERKKGGFARPAGLRCGQEGHGAQAPHPRRYTRPVVERHRPSRRRAGSRRRPRAASNRAPFVPLHRDHLRHGGYQGPRMAATVATTGCWKLEIVKRTDAHRFVALPKRWIGANVRLATGASPATSSVIHRCRLRPAMIRIMLRRLTPPTPCR